MSKSNIILGNKGTRIFIKTDIFDVITRYSDNNMLNISIDLGKNTELEDLPGNLRFDEIKQSIIYELYARDLHGIKKINPAIVLECPLDKDFVLYIETDKSDIYLSNNLVTELNKKIFCKAIKGRILRKMFMEFVEIT